MNALGLGRGRITNSSCDVNLISSAPINDVQTMGNALDPIEPGPWQIRHIPHRLEATTKIFFILVERFSFAQPRKPIGGETDHLLNRTAHMRAPIERETPW